MKKRNIRGDTLIEVLVAITVLGTVIAATYSLSSRASRIGQASQERAEAVKLMEQQSELVRTVIKDVAYINLRDDIRSAQDKCLFFGASGVEVTTLDNFREQCENYGGSRYNITLVYRGEDTYEVLANWEGAGSEDEQRGNLVFRVREI